MVQPDTFLCDSVEVWSVINPMTIAANRLGRMVVAVEAVMVSRANDDVPHLWANLRHDKDNTGF